MSLKLKCMGRLMKGKPHPKVVSRQTQHPLHGPDVRLDVVQLSRFHRLSPQQREVVLAKDAPGEVAKEQTQLRAKHRLVDTPPQYRRHGIVAVLRRFKVFQGGEEHLERLQIGVNPIYPVEGKGALQ